MTVGMAQGWQVMLADLALILFLTTAAALDSDKRSDASAPSVLEAPPEGSPQTPVAIFRAGDATRFSEWLASRASDPRETLTIFARHLPGHRDAALLQASAMAVEASSAGLDPRIVVEPGAADETLALFAFTSGPELARDLQISQQDAGVQPAR